jgi:drug/metabolite transporter (DMT)-like permease
MMLRNNSLRIAVAFAAVYLIWGSTYLAIAIAVDSVPPVFMVALRGLLAGGVLYLVTRLRGGSPVTAREILATVPTAALLFGGGYVLVGWAQQHLASGVAALLNATVPAFVVAMEWGTGQRARPGWKVSAGLVAGLLGIGILVFGNGEEGGLTILPAALIIVASLCWAAGSVRARSQAQSDPFRRAAVQLLTGGFLLFPVSALLGEFGVVLEGELQMRSLLALLYLVVFGSLIGYTAFVWLLHQVPAGKVASHAYVNPLIAVLVGSLVAHEPVSVTTVISALLIVGSVVAIVNGESGVVRGEGKPRSIAERARKTLVPRNI